MTDSGFDDRSFLDDLPDDVSSPGHPSMSQPVESHKRINRFNDDDMLETSPAQEPALYPELMAPKPDKLESIKRPCPWFIDVFLFPLNKSGILNLAITFGVPVILALLTMGCIAISRAMPLFIIVAVPVAMAGVLATLVMCLYFGWYVMECIRSSAEGQVRAPDTIGQTPGMWELFGLCYQVFICGLVFMGMSWSFHATFMPPMWGQMIMDTSLGLLLPMTLLHIISVDSIRGLNPITNLKFIGITFVPYLGMALPLYAAHRALFTTCMKLPLPFNLIVFGLCEVYGLMVSAHILGRYAWKQQDKLFWE